MRKKHKQVDIVLNKTEHLLILVPTVTGCVSVSTTTSLVGILLGIASSAVLKICVISAGIKKHESKRNKKNT